MHLRKSFVTALVLGSVFTAGSLALAQEPAAGNSAPNSATDHGSMMHDGGMTGMGMMNGVDSSQMNRMVENCNRMMEGMMRGQPTNPSTPNTQPAPNSKG